MTGSDDAATSHQQLVEQVLSGERPELRRLAAAGMLPLPPLELIRLQVALAEAAGGEVGLEAGASLASAEPKSLAAAIREGLEVDALAWIATHVRHPLVTEAVIRRPEVPRALLEALAPSLEPELQETLLLRQDAILELPAILDALERNPKLSSYARRRVAEYRRHLLPREADEPEIEAPPAPELEEPTEEEVQDAIEEAREVAADGEVDEITGLSESQLRTLPLPVRLKLSRNAPRALRSILIRDSNPTVAVSVLENNAMSESEIEQIARSRSVVDDVLTAISRNRSWIRKYVIILALVKNPRTPVGVAMRLAPRLSVRDLRAIARDRNVAQAVRAAGERLYKLKLS